MDTDNLLRDENSSKHVSGFKAESYTLLPRSAWNSQLTKLRLTLKVKQLLDQQEKSAK